MGSSYSEDLVLHTGCGGDIKRGSRDAIVKGASQALGVRSILRELGVKSKVTVNTDSASAKGLCKRSGLGKTKHIAVNL